MRGQGLKGHLDMLLLSMVDTGATHGYAIVEQLRRASDGTFDLPDGTVYPALHRLCDAGLLKSHWTDSGGRKRRDYALTPAGLKRLDQQKRDWDLFQRGVQAILSLQKA